ncbi:hypothetical protein [Microbacterium sp.]|uniref:hypothetical protein n=1 Tax=Microbacterium sp. TaxID=51671 RepID=UPI003F9C36C7
MPTVAIWLSAVSLVLCILLAVPYRALPFPSILVIVALAAVGITGLVLGIRARRSPSARGGWALICALTSLIIAVILTVVFIVGMISARSLNRVELHGQGPAGMSATFVNDTENRTVKWPAEGRANYNTKGSWVELTIEVPEDAASQTVSCQITWNDEVVVDETSDNGTVTCRYDAG